MGLQTHMWKVHSKAAVHGNRSTAGEEPASDQINVNREKQQNQLTVDVLMTVAV